MWKVTVFCVLCIQMFQRNMLQAQEDSDDLFFKIKGKNSKNTDASKKAKLESWQETQTEHHIATTSDLGISLPEEYANDTIKKDHHRYYNSTFYGNPQVGKSYWIDIDVLPEEHVVTNKMLSNSYRQATTIELSFDFPFYGSLLRNITLATGGFLYMGDYMHNWIAATQYVAPLMANFDTTISENSTIKYADNGTALIVQWDNVFIKDRAKDGSFTFQAALYQNGDICFAYKEVPFPISKISGENHPVKVGISDAYILERNVFFIRRKTIYEYHRVDMMKNKISNNTAIYFTALPTCLSYKDCESCMSADLSLECSWCDSVQRCSDGIDRQRQSWIVRGCAIRTRNVCMVHGSELPTVANTESATATTETTTKVSSKVLETNVNNPTEKLDVPGSWSKNSNNKGEAAHYIQEELQMKAANSVSTGAIVAIVVFIAILIAVSGWIFYAYKFPQTPSGQFLIKYRPSQWSFKPEGHSTNADSFHM